MLLFKKYINAFFTAYILYGSEGWLRFPDLWSGQKPWWNWYLTPVVSFGEVWRAQLAKSTLLTSTLGPLGIVSDLLRYVEMLKIKWVQKAMGSYHTYLSLVKLQPWFLHLQWKTCPWAEHSDDDIYFKCLF